MEKNINELSDSELDFEIRFEKEAMVKETIATAVSKVKFANEIKQGLGSEMKQKGGRVTIIEKTRYEKFVAWLKKIFTKF